MLLTLEAFLATAQAEWTAYTGAADKRTHLGERAGVLYDALAAPFDIPLIPDWIETRFIDPAGHAIAVRLAHAFYDGVMARIAAGEPVGWPAPVTECQDGATSAED